MKQIKILFVCHGNICRSPIAEFVFKDLVFKEGKSDMFYVSSAATSSEEIGNPVYPPAKAVLKKHGVGGYENKRAVKLKKSDYYDYDLIIGMDSENMYNMRRLFDGDPDDKVRSLMDYTGKGGEVSDPWYTLDFERAYKDISSGTRALLQSLLK